MLYFTYCHCEKWMKWTTKQSRIILIIQIDTSAKASVWHHFRHSEWRKQRHERSERWKFIIKNHAFWFKFERCRLLRPKKAKNLFVFYYYFHFLVPTRKRNKRNSRRRFRSHENSIIQQSSLTTRDFVYFLMFQNHSNSST